MTPGIESSKSGMKERHRRAYKSAARGSHDFHSFETIDAESIIPAIIGAISKDYRSRLRSTFILLSGRLIDDILKSKGNKQKFSDGLKRVVLKSTNCSIFLHGATSGSEFFVKSLLENIHTDCPSISDTVEFRFNRRSPHGRELCFVSLESTNQSEILVWAEAHCCDENITPTFEPFSSSYSMHNRPENIGRMIEIFRSYWSPDCTNTFARPAVG